MHIKRVFHSFVRAFQGICESCNSSSVLQHTCVSTCLPDIPAHGTRARTQAKAMRTHARACRMLYRRHSCFATSVAARRATPRQHLKANLMYASARLRTYNIAERYMRQSYPHFCKSDPHFCKSDISQKVLKIVTLNYGTR